MAYLGTVAKIPKDYNEVSIQRYVALVFALMEDVLSHKNYAQVFVMTAFCKEIQYDSSRRQFAHEVVDDNQLGLWIVKPIGTLAIHGGGTLQSTGDFQQPMPTYNSWPSNSSSRYPTSRWSSTPRERFEKTLRSSLDKRVEK